MGNYFRKNVLSFPPRPMAGRRKERQHGHKKDTARRTGGIEAAASTGFCNASYFSKVFREIVGQSPRKWRMTQKQTGRDSLVR